MVGFDEILNKTTVTFYQVGSYKFSHCINMPDVSINDTTIDVVENTFLSLFRDQCWRAMVFWVLSLMHIG